MFDYHVHTSFSEDSTASMESQCEAAVARGIRQIAFTEHEDYNPTDPTSFFFRHAEYMAELERCRALFAGRLIIRAGIEVSDDPLASISGCVEMIGDTGCGMYACKASVDMFDLTEDDFVPQIQGIITVGDFYDMAAGGQIIFT